MNSLKVGVFALALSFSMGVLAEDNIDRNTEKDKSMNNRHDCMELTGADNASCDQEMHNNNTNSKANDNSRINRKRSNNTRDDARSQDSNNKDSNNRDLQSIENSTGSSTGKPGVGTGTNDSSNINNGPDRSNGSKPK
jgi:hypothetical protein